METRRRVPPSSSTLAKPDKVVKRSIRCRRPRGAPRPEIKIPAYQQKKHQHHGRVKIDMLPVPERFKQAHPAGQNNRQRNRHIHIGMTGGKRLQRRPKKRPTGKNNRRQRNDACHPVHQIPCRQPHRLYGRAPKPDRQKHNIAHGKPRHTQTKKQEALFLLRSLLRAARVVGMHPISQSRHIPCKIIRTDSRAFPLHNQPAC